MGENKLEREGRLFYHGWAVFFSIKMVESLLKKEARYKGLGIGKEIPGRMESATTYTGMGHTVNSVWGRNAQKREAA